MTRPRHKGNQDGFSLIELLIVVAIIGIIAAIAIPNILASRRAANEGSAQSSLRTISSAQATYQSTNGHGAFGDLTELNSANLIDGVLASGSKSGYSFEVVDAAGTGSTAVYGCYAFPLTTTGVAQSGTRRFGITQTGILRGDSDLSEIPNTIVLIHGMTIMGN